MVSIKGVCKGGRRLTPSKKSRGEKEGFTSVGGGVEDLVKS